MTLFAKQLGKVTLTETDNSSKEFTRWKAELSKETVGVGRVLDASTSTDEKVLSDRAD
jgi:hypothetical protein